MPEELRIVWILAIGLSLACFFGYVCQKIKLSPLLGYLFAGYLIGPNSPGFIADQTISSQLASIGVTLLMFAVGLNFSWKDISKVKSIVIPGAISLSFMSILAGGFLSSFLGMSFKASLLIGIAVCVSSTVVVVRVLTDQKIIHSFQGHLVMGWTIVEDMISVLGLILMPSLVVASNTSSVFSSVLYSFTIVIVKACALALLVYFLGERVVIKLLKLVAKTRSHELFTLAVLSSVFLIAICSTQYFGISLALGAFIAGMILGNTEISHQAAANAIPMRDAFAVIFFLSVGMLFDPLAIQNNMILFFGILAIILLLRPFLAFVMTRFVKQSPFICAILAISISQIGEYSFILAAEGSRLNILPKAAFDIIIACAFVTIALNPMLFQLFGKFTKQRMDKKSDLDTLQMEGLSEEASVGSFLPKAIVIGFGPVGKVAAYHLTKKYQVLVIDQNIETIATSKEKNIKILFGDATKLILLERADIMNVELVVVTTPDIHTTDQIINSVQTANPNARIVARVHFEEDRKKAKFGDIPIVCDEEEAKEKMFALLHQLEK